MASGRQRFADVEIEDNRRRAQLAEETARLILRQAQSLGPSVQAAARRATAATRESLEWHRHHEGVRALVGGGLARTAPPALTVLGDWLLQEGYLVGVRRWARALQAEADAAQEELEAEQGRLQWLEELAVMPRWMAWQFRRRMALRLLEVTSSSP